jgi:fructose-1,6-bisphosphatase/sedoheptulose 1,7-bisphosphatase-like protein
MYLPGDLVPPITLDDMLKGEAVFFWNIGLPRRELLDGVRVLRVVVVTAFYP